MPLGNGNCRVAGVDTGLKERLARAAEILDGFAASTSVTAGTNPRRYLWTDAFAVMTWIGLHESEGERRFLVLARQLIEQVHDTLSPQPDAQHPTARGLRIGKSLPERGPDEPYDPDLEWERDGQYYHYLTKWMHALRRMGASSGEERYRRWAQELAQVAHRAFAYPAGAPRAMHWKMSVDLSRALVPSMGAHDPLDGLVEAASLGLRRETKELAQLCAGRRWMTDDPLAAGALLIAALRLARLVARGSKTLEPYFLQVLDDALASAQAVAPSIGGPAARRLAFRELGFALGLHAVASLGEHVSVRRLQAFVPVAAELEEFWLAASSQAGHTWTAHRDINAVSLAACLAPRGVLEN